MFDWLWLVVSADLMWEKNIIDWPMVGDDLIWDITIYDCILNWTLQNQHRKHQLNSTTKTQLNKVNCTNPTIIETPRTRHHKTEANLASVWFLTVYFHTRKCQGLIVCYVDKPLLKVFISRICYYFEALRDWDVWVVKALRWFCLGFTWFEQ